MTELGSNTLSNSKADWRQINWWLMLIPLTGWALSVGMFWVEVAIRPLKPAEAVQISAPAHPASQAPGKGKVHTPDGNYNDPFFQSLQDYLDRDCVAPVIVGLAAAIYLLAAFRQRSLLCLLLGLLATDFAFRELRDNQGLEAIVAWVCHSVGATCGDKAWEHFMTAWVYRFAGILVVVAAIFHRRLIKAMRADWRHTSWFLAVFASYAVCMLVQRRAFKWGPSEHHIHRSVEECTETVAHAMFVVAGLMALCRKTPAAPPAA